MPVRIGERYRDRYEVLGRIGEGAFAYVYRAREVGGGGRDVALKVLKEEYTGERDVVERFQREIFAIASINSPHVVSMLDFGITEGEFYMVMEYVQGPSLRDVMSSHEPFSPEDVLVVVGQIAHALAAAHRREIMHRDLKPENVMLVERGGSYVAKVLDFGFAKLAELERTLELRPITRVGFCFGTPQYLSPEQIRGRPIDGGADLFALGVIAYEMLAGHRPWDGKDARTIMTAVVKTLPPPVLRLHPSLMSRMEEVNRFLLRALEKERGERPHDAVMFFDELQDALFGDPEAARSALAGARPVQPLEDVTSRSIIIRQGTPAHGKQRFDETEIDPPRDDSGPLARPPVSPSPSDTVRETALETGSIPIFVAEKLKSQYLPPVDMGAEVAEWLSGSDSAKRTLPRVTAQVYKVPKRSKAGLVVTLIIVAILLTAGFLAGRYLKF